MIDAAGSVLVVDDDEALGETVCDLLTDEGYTALRFASGHAALDHLRASPSPPSVILLDLMMPGMNGWQFRAAQLEDPGLASIPVVVMTASRDVQAIEADEVVWKPVEIGDLLDVVRRYAARSVPSASSALPTGDERVRSPSPATLSLLQGGGEMGRFMRTFAWERTPLGAVDGWPQSLRTTVSLLLSSRYPMFVFWGPELVKIYNDAYRPIVGAKHPWALGRPAREVWPDIWDTIGPMVSRVMEDGESTWADDLPLLMHRNGFAEEVYFTFSYSPVRDETDTIAGLFCACTETTQKVLGERRLRLLRDLAATPSHARTIAEAARLSFSELAKYAADVPFSLLYLVGDDGDAHLHCVSGTETGSPVAPPVVAQGDDRTWPLSRVAASLHHEVVGDLAARFGAVPEGPFAEPPRSAMVLPLVARVHERAIGFVVLGVSARRPFDPDYQDFFGLVAGQIATSIENARASEEEHRRAEALAEIDRAKTAFFSNVSHEFRTPLTLMLGPLEDALADTEHPLSPTQRERQDLVLRNARRLQKLVNALLDFARIEAGRAQAAFVPTDLATFTADLASAFRSAIESAGLELVVDCGGVEGPIQVDRSMWEKIVLNLLSNALKFTFEGRIEVALEDRGDDVALRVADTGVGVPEAEVPRLFDRFHRVEGTRARTHEGSGIGLALVRDLAKLHGGSVSAESRLGEGTTFTVTIPKVSARLHEPLVSAPPEPKAATAAFLEEAHGWLRGDPERVDGRTAAEPGRSARILLADDNADMRGYVTRLLEPEHAVLAVADGTRALELARAHTFDLVLTDVMMPGLDGFGLLRALREDERTRGIPVVMLSARAGEEAKVEGLDAGADDYLVKPFSARELLARVRTQLELSALRVQMRERYELLGSIVQQAPVPMCVLAGRELVFELANELYGSLVGARELVGLPLLRALPELAGQGFDDLLLRVMDTQTPHVAREAHARLARGEGGGLEDSWWTFVYAPLHGADGRERVIVVAHDVTDQVRARNLVQASEERFRRVVDQVEAGIAQTDLRGRFVLTNERYRQITGRSAEELSQLHVEDIVHPDDAALLHEKLDAAIERGIPFVIEQRFVRPDGSIVWVQSSVARIGDDLRAPTGIAAVTIDITQRKLAEAARVSHVADMERALRFSEMFVGILGHDLRNPLSAISMAASLLSRRAAESPWLARPVGRILTSSDRMERMISQLLDFTQIRLGQGLPVRVDWIDLHDVARATVEELEPVFDREIALHVEGDTHAAADRDRLSQLVSNLVANAAQHGTPGTPVRIHIDGAHADRLTLEVQNAGVIASDVLPTLFEPLRTGGDGARRRGGSSGLGLGLYITHQIALSHGGSIKVRSDEDRGTRFVVDLPRRPAPDVADERI